MFKISRGLAWRCLGVALLATTALQARADQTCVDNVVSACFENCTDPSKFQECILGCNSGAGGTRRDCLDQCFGDPTCLSKCMPLAADVQACRGATRKVDVVRGALTLNRATGVWQQTLRLTNNTALETLHNVALVLDALEPGWTLANADGTTVTLPPNGSPYKEVAATLLPGQSVTLLLRFARTGTPAFGCTPVVYNVPNR